MKASRTLNWYFCLCSIVRVCCEMVKKIRRHLSFSKNKILIHFIHFTKKCARML